MIDVSISSHDKHNRIKLLEKINDSETDVHILIRYFNIYNTANSSKNISNKTSNKKLKL